MGRVGAWDSGSFLGGGCLWRRVASDTVGGMGGWGLRHHPWNTTRKRGGLHPRETHGKPLEKIS